MDKKQIPDPYNGVVFDTELDDFVFGATQMWTLVISDLKNKRDRLKVNPFKEPDAARKVMEFINRYEKPKIVFHNGLGFDIFIMFPFLGIEHTVGPDTIGGKECEFVDTFYLSMFLNPDREAHSVDHFGSILGLPKIDWRQRAIELGLIESTAPKGAEFKQYHPEMDVYCLTPDHKVLREDLRWTELGNIVEGDRIMGFDELGPQRKFKTSTVTSVNRKVAPVYAVTLSNGDVIKTTGEHKWLTVHKRPKGQKGVGAYNWVETKNLRTGEKFGTKVPKIVEPWEEDMDKDSGWLAGMFDGEGSVRKTSFGISIAQRPTAVLERIERVLNDKGVGFGKRITKEGSDCVSLNLHGSACDKMAFLGTHRPERLVGKFTFEKLGRFEHKGETVEVESVDFIGDMEIIEMQTDTKTFIADGYPMHNCDRDVDVNMIIYDYLLNEWFDVYGFEFHHTQAYACGQKSFYLMSCQELAGWKFDIEGGIALKKRIAEMMEEIRVKVEPQLPPRALKKAEEKEYTMPAKPFKKNGDLSAIMEKFIEKHSLELVDGVSIIFNGVKYPIVPGSMLDVKLPMEMANQDQMKDWFLEQGWEPTFWNHKKGPDGKPMRDPMTRELIRTSPKIQEQGKLCPNLEKLEGEIAKDVVKWLSLRNRQSVLEGWLENPRLQMDGRIGAGRTGIAATHRQKHKVVVNVPKADPKVLLGYEFRALWIAEEGYLIAAGDAAALEGRVQGHYAYRYDGGVTAEELLKGDVHSKNAYYFYKDIYEEVAELYNAPDFDKENPRWKRYRNPSKNGFYAILYGASGPKVASTLGIPLQYGQAALEAFWEANPGTKALKENVERYWNTIGKKKYLPGIDGRILLTRKKSALLNTIFQSCGGIVMDYAGCYMDRWLGGLKWKDRKPYYEYKGYIVRRIGYFHK